MKEGKGKKYNNWAFILQLQPNLKRRENEMIVDCMCMLNHSASSNQYIKLHSGIQSKRPATIEGLRSSADRNHYFNELELWQSSNEAVSPIALVWNWTSNKSFRIAWKKGRHLNAKFQIQNATSQHLLVTLSHQLISYSMTTVIFHRLPACECEECCRNTIKHLQWVESSQVCS